MHGLGTPAAFYGGFIAPGGNEERGRDSKSGGTGIKISAYVYTICKRILCT